MNKELPTNIVILGGTGDLSQRKLLPALFRLFQQNALPKDFAIIGVARTQRTNREYRDFVRDSINDSADQTSIATFCSHIYYISGSFTESATYHRIYELQNEIASNYLLHANQIFYLAVPPRHYGDIFTILHDTRNREGGGWFRILVEKPFGKDTATALALDKKLGSLFKEDEIYRIDHYLAKEAVQNLLIFRFTNTFLRSAWDSRAISQITITMHESVDVAHRGNFYDDIGALRDVGQNHLLQLLALTTMNEPASLTEAAIRRERERVLEALVPLTQKTLPTAVIRAQYDTYQQTENIAINSQTETYFSLRCALDLPEWSEVPIYITAGKALAQDLVSVTILYKELTNSPFSTEHKQPRPNKIVFTISPQQAIAISMNVKKPGLQSTVEERQLMLPYHDDNNEIKNAYEKVLHASIVGDQTLFTTTKEVLAAWRFITPIIENWQTLPLHSYAKGSEGPAVTLL